MELLHGELLRVNAPISSGIEGFSYNQTGEDYRKARSLDTRKDSLRTETGDSEFGPRALFLGSFLG